MTYLPDDTHTYSRDTYPPYPVLQLPGWRWEPGMIDTVPLRLRLSALMAQAAAMVSPERVKHGARARLQKARRVFVQLFRAETHNVAIKLVKAMQANPLWQAQVRKDLGGEAALARWDKRYARRLSKQMDAEYVATEIMSTGIMAPKQKETEDKKTNERAVPCDRGRSHTPRENRKPWRPVTDRHNIFRLASLRTETCRAKPSYRFRSAMPHKDVPRKRVAAPLCPLAPIPLRPDQLRPPQREAEREEATGPNRDNSAGLAAINKAPALSRRDITAWWAHLVDAYSRLNDRIMDMHGMISLPPTRRNPLLM